MTPTGRLYYALGQIVYAISGIDGKVQKEERNRFHDIIVAEFKGKHYDFDISEIIFTILDRDKSEPETAYTWAMSEMRLNSHYLTPEMKRVFIIIAQKIAEAFPPVTREEAVLLEQFKTDIAPLKGDSVYTS